MRTHVEKVLAGEYAAPVKFNTAPQILDIGANIGSFTIWAIQHWPGAKLVGYEPHPLNAAAWRENCASLMASGQASLIEAAVTDKDGEAGLRDGVHNCGEASLVFQHPTSSRMVRTISASSLPPCDILKLDTEGCELVILHHYRHTLEIPLILLEFHSDSDRDTIHRLLNPTHRLCELHNWQVGSGIMKWLRR